MLKTILSGGKNSKEMHAELRDFLSADKVIERTRNCSHYFSTMQPTLFLSELYEYNVKDCTNPDSDMYRQKFSVAFAHMVHDEPGIFELFMLLYFRPYNSHCVHIDAKVS